MCSGWFNSKEHGFTFIEVLVALAVISALSLIGLASSFGVRGRVTDVTKKRDINLIADAYEASYESNNNQYRPLQVTDFSVHKIPSPDDGGAYTGLLTEDAPSFQVCAALSTHSSSSCSTPSETCYCLESLRGDFDGESPTPTPDADPTPTPNTPTPTPEEECSLDEAYWDENVLTEGTQVILTVEGIGNCIGMEVDFEVIEHDSILEGGLDDPADIQPPGGNFPGSNILTTTWTAEWENDCLGLCLPPEYYFNAILVGVETQRSLEPNLEVNQVSPSPTPTATPTPTPEVYKRIFVRSTLQGGNLGGLSGADTLCQNTANSSGLGGTWKAWLSSSSPSVSASSRLSHSSDPYKLINGTLVANNWTDLTDGTLAAAININESGDSIASGNVWTDTTPAGEVGNTNSCGGNWGSNSSALRGIKGDLNSTTTTWSQNSSVTCNNTAHIYCIEQ